ncbi:MAG: Wzz/FepE/Etk N-terminal domain-containing protein [bacterium]
MDEYRVTNKSLRDLLYVIFKHKGKIVLVFLTVFALAVLVISMQKPVYVSTAKILVKEGRENSTPTTAVMDVPERIMDTTRLEDINSEIEILRSRLLAEKVVEKLGYDLTSSSADTGQAPARSAISQILSNSIQALKNLLSHLFPSPLLTSSPLSPFESAVLTIQRHLAVQLVENSNVIQVSFSSPDPRVTVDVINTLLDFYLDHHLLVHKTPGAYQFFSDQAIEFQQKLEDSEKRLEEFKKRSSLAELDLQREILLRQKGEYESGLEQVESSIDGTKEQLQQQEDQLADQEHIIWQYEISRVNPLKEQLDSQLSQLKLQEQRLMNMFADANQRRILDIRKEIGDVESQLKKLPGPEQFEVRVGLNDLYLRLTESILKNQADLRSFMAKRDNLEKNLLICEQKLNDLNETEVELNQLQRQIKIEEENFRLYRKKVEENRISDAMDTARFANISVIEPALTPLLPKPSMKMVKVFVAVVLGLAAGLGTALLFELMDHSIGTAEELEASLDLPVLGSIPEVKE